MIYNVLIRPRDPMLFRDGRPFNAGQGARTIPWPMPSTVSGFLRTRLARGRTFPDPTLSADLLKVRHVGPFLACQTGEDSWELAFAAPADAGVYADGRNLKLIPFRPSSSNHSDNTDMPVIAGRRLALLAPSLVDKPSPDAPPFWMASKTLSWLARTDGKEGVDTADQLGVKLHNHVRLHTQIQPGQRNVVKHMLFRTSSLEFDFDRDFHQDVPNPRLRRTPVNSRLGFGVFSSLDSDLNNATAPYGVGAFGGEQRLAEYVAAPASLSLPAVPAEKFGKRIRLQLITPGVFDRGWLPGWAVHGKPPGFPGLELKLIAAAVRRYDAVSGFDFTRQGQERIRATRFLAPAGSTYFFEVVSGDPGQLWLQSICDQKQDGLDGFGVVLVGAWQWHQ